MYLQDRWATIRFYRFKLAEWLAGWPGWVFGKCNANGICNAQISLELDSLINKTVHN